MSKDADFKEIITQGYTFKGSSVLLGAAMLHGHALEGLQVRAPLKMFNRHGLIAGATGTGKTKTLQVLAEALSEQGVPVLLMDIKGDLSGISQPGNEHPKISERHKLIGEEWKPEAFPVELLTISDEPGVRMRATVSEFGPVLFSKILELNDTQSSVVSVVFKYADDQQLPLLDLKDFRKVLQYITNEGKNEIEREYGRISTSSTGAIIRKIIELEQQKADLFFGERSFEVNDLMRISELGSGYINILRLVDIQDRPKLFSTFMLCLLSEIYQTFPEIGDQEEPQLVIFIDEAHLIFEEASKALLDQIESIIKLIRSKGVGIFFCTQLPADVPESVLSQLGMKVQHALRAFTAKDRKSIKLAAENYPSSDFYKTEDELTALGIGEAFVSVLNEKGIPTPLARVLLRAPFSRMDIISEAEFQEIMQRSQLKYKYNEEIDRESAYEILDKKLKAAAANETIDTDQANEEAKRKAREEPGMLEELSKNTMVRQVGRTLVRELTRGLLGVLGVRTTTRRTTTRRRRY